LSNEGHRRARHQVLRPRPRDEVAEELAFHLEMRTRELVRGGMAEAAARAAAVSRFGDLSGVASECRRLAEEREREMRRTEYLSELGSDVRYCARQLRRAPGFAAVAILTLGLGIGATTAIFSVVRGVLLRPLPYPAAERLVVPRSIDLASGDRWNVTYADYQDWRSAGIFSHVALYQPTEVNLGGEGPPERIEGVRVTEDFFATLGVAPTLGRTLRPDEFVVGSPRRAVISYGLWQRRFGGDPGIVGRSIRVTGAPVEVVGVLPRDMSFPSATEIWLPVKIPPEDVADYERRDNYVFGGIGRLGPGQTIEQTRARLATLAARIARALPATRAHISVTVTPLVAWMVGETMTRALWIFFGAVVFVLLIACVNVANLLMSRAAARGRELAVRASIGASRARLVRQLLTESVVLALAGGALGSGIAWLGVRVLVALAPADLPRSAEIGIDPLVLLFAAGVSIVAAVMFGLVPALRGSREDALAVLNEADRRTTTGVRGRYRRQLLVATELALAMVLLIGAGLLLRSFDRLRVTDPGVRADHLLTFSLSLQGEKYESDAVSEAAFRTLLDRLRALPGVERAAITSSLPVGGGGFYLGRAFLAEGRPEPPAGKDLGAQWVVASPGLFGTLEIPLLAGRTFTAQDDSASTPVMIVSREFVRRMFPDGKALGKRVRSWRDENVYREIVGVVEDVRYFSAGDSIRPLVYVPLPQCLWHSMVVTVRTSLPPASLAPSVRVVVARLDPDLAVDDVQTMEQVLNHSRARSRFSAALLSLFAALALVLAVVGTYGVLSYGVTQRRREIGIRMALGARPGMVLRMVLREAGGVVVVGLAAGSLGAFALTRLMRGLLYEVNAVDAATYTAVAALLAAAAIVASLVPARQAASVDPASTIREG
jgi:putative ABC transport system permease protein